MNWKGLGFWIGILWLVSIPFIGMGWITGYFLIFMTGLPCLIFGLKIKHIYVRVTRGDSNTVYGPYKTLKEADEDTADLDCDEKGAFKARVYKGAIRVHTPSTGKWW